MMLEFLITWVFGASAFFERACFGYRMVGWQKHLEFLDALPHLLLVEVGA
jgi:hypothetical protein